MLQAQAVLAACLPVQACAVQLCTWPWLLPAWPWALLVPTVKQHIMRYAVCLHACTLAVLHLQFCRILFCGCMLHNECWLLVGACSVLLRKLCSCCLLLRIVLRALVGCHLPEHYCMLAKAHMMHDEA